MLTNGNIFHAIVRFIRKTKDKRRSNREKNSFFKYKTSCHFLIKRKPFIGIQLLGYQEPVVYINLSKLENCPRNSAVFFFSLFFLLSKKRSNLSFSFILYRQRYNNMGNSISKKKSNKKDKRSSKKQKPPVIRQSTPRLDLPDNENSVNTTQSVNSILITSSQHRRNNQQQNNSALSQLNPDYPVGNTAEDATNEQDTVQAGDAFMGKVEHPQQHKLLAQSDFWPPKKASGQALDIDTVDNNQLTVSSMNQLTVNSVSSMNMQGVAQIDEYIRRLLDAGYAHKVPKQLCLKHAEVNAICRAAMDIFLSQPVSFLLNELGS